MTPAQIRQFVATRFTASSCSKKWMDEASKELLSAADKIDQLQVDNKLMFDALCEINLMFHEVKNQAIN